MLFLGALLAGIRWRWAQKHVSGPGLKSVQTVQGARGQITRYRAMASVPAHSARQKLKSGTFGNFFKEHAALMSHGIFCG